LDGCVLVVSFEPNLVALVAGTLSNATAIAVPTMMLKPDITFSSMCPSQTRYGEDYERKQTNECSVSAEFSVVTTMT
jgi:hypothetical protein